MFKNINRVTKVEFIPLSSDSNSKVVDKTYLSML